MNKHTPGPWVAESERCAGDNIFSASGDRIANVYGYLDCDPYKSNAALIAAAPDLLEALKELVDLVDGIRDGSYTPDSFTCQPAAAAIKKAEGGAR